MDFTGLAKKYAAVSNVINGREIILFHLRPSVKQYEKGRVLEMHLRILFHLPAYDDAKYPSGPTLAAKSFRKWL